MTPETINGRSNSEGPVAQRIYIAFKSSIYLDSFIEKKTTAQLNFRTFWN